MLRRILKISVYCVCWGAIFNSLSFADIVYLKDGGMLEGVIVEETNEGLTLKVNLGTLSLTSEEIHGYEKKEFNKGRDIYPARNARGLWIPVHSNDVRSIATEINSYEEPLERDAYCRIYFKLASQYQGEARSEEIPLRRQKKLIIARSCYEVVKECAASENKEVKVVTENGVAVEGYSLLGGMKLAAEKAIEECNAELSREIKLPGLDAGSGVEEITAAILTGDRETRENASREYFDAAKYYEELSRNDKDPDYSEYIKIAMDCYLIAYKTHPYDDIRKAAWAGYKRCSMAILLNKPGRLM